MTKDDGPNFKQVLAALYTLYGKELTPTALNLWYEALKAYDVHVVSAALSQHVRDPDSGQFLPRPADVVKFIQGGSADAALVAWAKLDYAVRCIGPYASVVFDDPLIHYALANIGGWIALGTKSEEEWPFLRNQFVTLYRGARHRGTLEFPEKFVGIAEMENVMRAQPVSDPVLLGDSQAALAVLRRGSDRPRLTARPLGQVLAAALERKEIAA